MLSSQVQPVPNVLNLEQFGFKPVMQFSPLYDQPVYMAMQATRPPSPTDFEIVTRDLLAIVFGKEWLVGDLMAMFGRAFPERFIQAAPILDKAVKTLQNWQSVANAYPELYLERSKNIVIDKVFKNEMILSGQHIGKFRHAGLDWSFHQECQALRKDKDQLDIRALTLATALADNATLQDMKLFKKKRLEELATKGNRSIQDFLDQQRNWRITKTVHTSAVTRFELNVKQGTVYTDILAELRALARDVEAASAYGDIKIVGRIAK